MIKLSLTNWSQAGTEFQCRYGKFMLALPVVPNEKALLACDKDGYSFKVVNHKPRFSQFPWFASN